MPAPPHFCNPSNPETGLPLESASMFQPEWLGFASICAATSGRPFSYNSVPEDANVNIHLQNTEDNLAVLTPRTVAQLEFALQITFLYLYLRHRVQQRKLSRLHWTPSV